MGEIKHGSKGRYNAMIKEVEARYEEFISCEFIFEWRTLNFEAHSLAKNSSSLAVSPHVWLGISHGPFIIHVNQTPS